MTHHKHDLFLTPDPIENSNPIIWRCHRSVVSGVETVGWLCLALIVALAIYDVSAVGRQLYAFHKLHGHELQKREATVTVISQ